MSVLYESWTEAGGDWKKSKIYLQVTSKDKTKRMGVREWMHRAEIEKKFGVAGATAIINRSFQIRNWRRLKYALILRLLMLKNSPNIWSWTWKRKWKAMRHVWTDCTKLQRTTVPAAMKTVLFRTVVAAAAIQHPRRPRRKTRKKQKKLVRKRRRPWCIHNMFCHRF